MRKLFGALTAVMTVAALTVPLMAQPAQANHGARTLEVTPEVETYQTGSTASFTAVLLNANGSGAAPADATSGSIRIEFEIEGSGANNPDGNTRETPDLACTVPVGLNTCTASFVGQNSASNTVVGWIDHDGFNSDESDPDEGREASKNNNSGFDDCDQAQDEDSDCLVNILGVQTPPEPGSGCGTVPNDAEPDCTDVVSVSFSNVAAQPTTLDCDDRSGASGQDTERETNPSTTAVNDQSSERYRCQVKDQFGGGMNGQRVNAEVENGVNDNDGVDGASYDSPDYGCPSTSRDPDVPPGFSADSGICYITVTQNEGELGTAEICFWVGTGAQGASLCADEPTGENQQPNGADSGNDLADQVELTWAETSEFRLDCSPETDTNPAGSNHQIVCTANDPNSSRSVSGVTVRAEIAGAGDTDGDTPQNPDRTCTTGADGTCTISHTSSAQGDTTYRAWIDDGTAEPRSDGTDEDVDRTEGQDETAAAGEKPEPDTTDVMTKNWGAPATSLVMTPEIDSANVGECNPFTVTVSSGSGNDTAPVQGVTLDVEQRHERATGQNDPIGDEPTVEFCTPPTGPNPSDVDTTRGDLGPNSAQENDRESPDNKGTAGGETNRQTDANGRLTFGIKVTPGQGSDGSGSVTVVAFIDSNNDDDPQSGELQDSSIKNWQAASSAEGRTIACSPESASNPVNTDHTVTCTVMSSSNQPVQGEDVTWSETGPGEFEGTPEATTNSSGQARATVTSSEVGSQTITATLTDDTGAGEPEDVDDCDRPANDPSQGAPEGNCSDSVTKTWTEGGTCPGHENDPRNQIVGTPGNDELNGTSDDDVICGLGGDDTIKGGGGDDLILGGGGNDDLRGQGGNDEIRGGGGKDAIRGNAGNDRLVGGSQNDIILGNVGEDTLVGNSGEDILRGGKDVDEVRGGRHDDTLQGGRGGDLLRGGKGKDTLRGTGGHDTIRGGGGDDALRGGRGNDKLNGGSGTDSCVGGPGRDRRINCEG